jgi:hypothetical protein
MLHSYLQAEAGAIGPLEATIPRDYLTPLPQKYAMRQPEQADTYPYMHLSLHFIDHEFLSAK